MMNDTCDGMNLIHLT